MEKLSMAQVVDQGEFCTRCRWYEEENCFEKCNSYLDGKPKKKREVIEDDRSN
jgi:hypothetical protein